MLQPIIMSTTQEAVRIPIVNCGECGDAFDVAEWGQLVMLEKREATGKSEGAEVRRCCGCDSPIVVPCGLLADAREGFMVATREQYEQMYPDTGRASVEPPPSFLRRAWQQLTGQ